VQEEAPSLGKPVLVLRDTTERQEGILAGTAELVGTNEEDIFNSVRELLDNKTKYEGMSSAINPYGDGMASRRIVDILLNYFCRDVERRGTLLDNHQHGCKKSC